MLQYILSTLLALTVHTYMSPNDNVEKALIEAMNKETKSIKVAMHTFTNKRIAKALIDAKERGVDVEVLVDGFTQGPLVDQLVEGKVPVYSYTPAEQKGWTSLMHHKFCLFEASHSVWTGSYNFTYKAEGSNAENAILIEEDEKNYTKFIEEFTTLQKNKSAQVTQKEKSATLTGNG